MCNGWAWTMTKGSLGFCGEGRGIRPALSSRIEGDEDEDEVEVERDQVEVF